MKIKTVYDQIIPQNDEETKRLSLVADTGKLPAAIVFENLDEIIDTINALEKALKAKHNVWCTCPNNMKIDTSKFVSEFKDVEGQVDDIKKFTPPPAPQGQPMGNKKPVKKKKTVRKRKGKK